MLCNPICGVVYALTVWRFFRDGTEEEEISLIHFFGEEYLEYKKRVPTGLPFIKGVKVELLWAEASRDPGPLAPSSPGQNCFQLATEE